MYVQSLLASTFLKAIKQGRSPSGTNITLMAWKGKQLYLQCEEIAIVKRVL